jgi:hypothetical protein
VDVPGISVKESYIFGQYGLIKGSKIGVFWKFWCLLYAREVPG